MSSSPPLKIDEETREVLRKRGEPIGFELSLTKRDLNDQVDVRMGLPKLVWEQYEKIPEKTQAWYDPGEKVLIIDLPGK